MRLLVQRPSGGDVLKYFMRFLDGCCLVGAALTLHQGHPLFALFLVAAYAVPHARGRR